MQHAKLLDCTLRDGAYLLDKRFGDNNIRGIIAGLIKARVDLIEVGFFQDEGFGEGKTVFKNSADAKRFIPKDKGGCMFTVLADHSRYSIDNLDECMPDSIDAVRECFFKVERAAAIEDCKRIKEKGYRCFVQPVDILGYSDIELIEFLEMVNEVEPYCLSIVDTFGSMYQEDLHRVFELIDHNLVSTCKVGFHSHNNMQMSNALSQGFVRMTYGKREAIVDGTISGMGRGAGNTPTELIAQYMVSKLGYNYDIDALLDIIDDHMDNIRTRCTWGYSTPFFVAGCYSAHVNNIAYLTQKNSIRSKDIRYILNKIGAIPRKRYDYDLLEKTYVEYLGSDIDDRAALERLRAELEGRDVLLLLPGSTATTEQERIDTYIDRHEPVVISINYVHSRIRSDFVYMSNLRRYSYWKDDPSYTAQERIVTSNIKTGTDDDKEIVISFNKLIKCGWDHVDNSGLMVLRLLDRFDVRSIAVAGFDGYSYRTGTSRNYATEDLELSNVSEDPGKLNKEIGSQLKDYLETREHHCGFKFITESRFSDVLDGAL